VLQEHDYRGLSHQKVDIRWGVAWTVRTVWLFISDLADAEYEWTRRRVREDEDLDHCNEYTIDFWVF
jgi:hypothetical protein